MVKYIVAVVMACLFGCGQQDERPTPRFYNECEGAPMLTLNDNFKAALNRPNTPTFIVKFVQSEIYAEAASQTDWLAYKQAVNVDLATEPGSVILPKVAVGGITQITYN